MKVSSGRAAEDTGARSFGYGAEAEQDAVEEVVGEAADAVWRPVAFRGHGDLLLIESHGGRPVVASEQSAHSSYSALSNGWIFLHLKLT